MTDQHECAGMGCGPTSACSPECEDRFREQRNQIEGLPEFRGTVVPWPGEIDTVGICSQCEPLSHEQDARATALYHAREVLGRRGPMGSTTPPSIDQLIRVANWILTGDDPL
jgi:hypothetical protein